MEKYKKDQKNAKTKLYCMNFEAFERKIKQYFLPFHRKSDVVKTYNLLIIRKLEVLPKLLTVSVSESQLVKMSFPLPSIYIYISDY